MAKTIKISCKCSDSLPIDQLKAFQGKLKTIDEEAFTKLKESISRYGFSFPIFIWNKNILDGHQRFYAVQRLIDEGYELTDNALPVVWIEAKNAREAAEKLLLINSRYAKIDQQGFEIFIEDYDIKLEDIEIVLDIPEIILAETGETDPYEEWDGMPEFEQEDNRPFRSLIVHFENKDYFKDFCILINQVISEDAKYIYYPKKIRDDVKSSAYKDES